MPKTCPYCAETVQDAATVCPHCRKNIGPGHAVAAVGKGMMGIGCGLIILTVPLALLAILIASRCG